MRLSKSHRSLRQCLGPLRLAVGWTCVLTKMENWVKVKSNLLSYCFTLYSANAVFFFVFFGLEARLKYEHSASFCTELRLSCKTRPHFVGRTATWASINIKQTMLTWSRGSWCGRETSHNCHLYHCLDLVLECCGCDGHNWWGNSGLC